MNRLRVYLSFSLIGLLLCGIAQAQVPTSSNDTDRANALLKQMRTEEKIGQLNQPFYLKLPIPGVKTDPVSYEDRARRGEVGSFLFLTDPKEINRLQKIAMTEQRLHIPILFGFDVIHGFDTEFPVPLAMAASWDPAMAEQAQAIASEEAALAGVHWLPDCSLHLIGRGSLSQERLWLPNRFICTQLIPVKCICIEISTMARSLMFQSVWD